MKLFIDTANMDEIREASAMGIISGVTTNPSLMAKEGKDIPTTLTLIAELVDGPISGEVSAFATQAEEMIKEGRDIAALHENMVVKIPMSVEGLKAIHVLHQEGISTNCTLIFSASQALLAACAGASYVSPFLGRLDDISNDGLQVVEDICDLFTRQRIKTQVIAASIRHPMHVVACGKLGADIATVPYKVLKQMLQHPLTDIGIEKFKADQLKAHQ